MNSKKSPQHKKTERDQFSVQKCDPDSHFVQALGHYWDFYSQKWGLIPAVSCGVQENKKLLIFCTKEPWFSFVSYPFFWNKSKSFGDHKRLILSFAILGEKYV